MRRSRHFPRKPQPTSATAAVRSGFGGLARSLSEWTSKLLATAIVLVGGLSLGWQVLAWWHEGTPDRLPLVLATDEVSGDQTTSTPIGFSSHRGPLRIDRVSGDEAAARHVLRERCLEESHQAEWRAEAGAGEQQFLASLVTLKPVVQWSDYAIYEPAAGPAMAVTVDRAKERIVCWSFAMPSGDGEWACYTFRPQAGDAVSPLERLPGVTP